LPNTATDTRYLDRLRPRGEVRSEVSYAQFDVATLLFPAIDPDGVGWVHYQALIPPAYLALEERGAHSAASLELYAAARDREGRTVRQVTEEIELDLSPEQARLAVGAPLAFQGRVALIPGSYQVSFLVRNRRTGAFGTG